MKDPAHHPKSVQKKILQETRKTSEESMNGEKKVSINNFKENSRLNPEYEGERFDSNHRKPRILKRIAYH